MSKQGITRIAVTGGAGFIGSHLVRHAAHSLELQVCAIDHLRCGKLEYLNDLPGNASFVQLDIGASEAEGQLREIFLGVDAVVHLAAEKHNQSITDPSCLLRTNVDGTLRVARLAAETGVKKVVFSSSLYAYGRMQGAAMLEAEPAAPRTLYGSSKLLGEQIFLHYGKHAGLKFDALRYFFTYGPRQFAGMGYKSVIVKNFERLLAGEAPVVCGDGRQTLDYIFVEDVVDATLKTLFRSESGEVFNVCSGRAVSVLELIQLMQEVAGTKYQPMFIAADETAGTSRFGSPDKLCRALNWAPKVVLADGLSRTFEWMKSSAGSC